MVECEESRGEGRRARGMGREILRGAWRRELGLEPGRV